MRPYSKYGEIIRRLRKDKNLTQEQLAEKANLDPKTIIQVEAGKRNPTLKSLQKISNALGVSISQILEA